jgi:hypothetical protein
MALRRSRRRLSCPSGKRELAATGRRAAGLETVVELVPPGRGSQTRSWLYVRPSRVVASRGLTTKLPVSSIG